MALKEEAQRDELASKRKRNKKRARKQKMTVKIASKRQNRTARNAVCFCS